MRSMKNFMIIFVVMMPILLCGGQIFGVAVKYNTPIMIKSKKFTEKTVSRGWWVHAWSRDIKNNPTDQSEKEGDWGVGRFANRMPNIAAPENHHEILIGMGSDADTRDENGNQFFIIQDATDEAKTGIVRYGDAVKILATFSGAGVKEEAGLQVKPRVLWVHNPAALFYPDGCEIVVSVPECKETQTSKAHFAFMSSDKGNGLPVESGDVLYLRSLSGDPKSDSARLWAYEFSRWGTGYQCLVLNKGDMRETDNGKFQIQIVQKSDLTADGQKAYDELMVAPGYAFLKEKIKKVEPVKNEQKKEENLYGTLTELEKKEAELKKDIEAFEKEKAGKEKSIVGQKK
ncbi:MAG: hypothetical protein ABH827_01750 [bacterium]